MTDAEVMSSKCLHGLFHLKVFKKLEKKNRLHKNPAAAAPSLTNSKTTGGQPSHPENLLKLFYAPMPCLCACMFQKAVDVYFRR